MFRRRFFAAVVVGISCASRVAAEGINFQTPDAIPGSPVNSQFASTSPFGTPGNSSSLLSFDASPPSTLPVPILPTGDARSGVVGHLSSRDVHRILGPPSPLTGGANNVLGSIGRYDSGASSRLSTMPTAGGGLIQQFQIPTVSVGPSRGLQGSGIQPVMFSPTSTPPGLFGAP